MVNLQNKAIRIINFLPFNNSNIKKNYNDLKILKFPDIILLQNSLFVEDCFEKELSTTFKNQGLNIPIEHAPHLKTVLLYQKLTQTFMGKNPSNTMH